MRKNSSNITNKLFKWSQKNLRKFPWRRKGVTPYQIFVAEFLLKRTTAKAASQVYSKFIKKYTSLKKLSSANHKDIENLVKPIGYPQRAREIKKAVNFINKQYGGQIPKTKEKLLTIPYVGDYTSSAIVSLAFNQPAAMIDSNVSRIISRVYFGLTSYNPSKKIKDKAEEIISNKKHRTLNLAMIDIGGTVCLPANPKCNLCPLAKHCLFRKES